MRILAGLLFLAALLAPVASAQYPRGVIAEDGTATWCTYCPDAYAGLDVMMARYNRSEFTSTRLYSSSSGGGLSTAETDARLSYYAITSFPTVVFDGTIKVVGGGTSVASGQAYEPIVAKEILRPSPLKIRINTIDLVQPDGSIDFDIEVMETMADIGNVKIRAYILEDKVTYSGRQHDEVTRDVLPEVALNVQTLGQVQNITHNFTLPPGWKTVDLWMAIFVQDNDDKSILQSASSQPTPAYSIRAWSKGDRAVVAPSGTAFDFQDFRVYNLGLNADVIRVALNVPSLPSGWACFFTDGITEYTDYVDLALNPGEHQTFHLRVDAPYRGFTKPTIELTSPNLPGVTREIPYSFITDDVQVLLVDDDGAETFEDYFQDAVQAYGSSYGIWDTGLAPVTGPALTQFPVVVWWTGLAYPTLDDADRAALTTFLNGGGSLFITGQDLGWELAYYGGAGLVWYNNYLHANYIMDDTNVYNLTGVGGDPISNGMTLSIAGGDGANNQEYPDAIAARDAMATNIFTYNGMSPTRYGAIKISTGVYKAVYLGFGFEAISTQANRRLLMQRSLQWFGLVPSDVEEMSADRAGTSIAAFPNPAAPGATLSYRVSSSGRAEIEIFGLDGSLVRTLLKEDRPAGNHTLYWDGRDDAGREVPSGVYFFKLAAGGDRSSGKVVLTR